MLASPAALSIGGHATARNQLQTSKPLHHQSRGIAMTLHLGSFCDGDGGVNSLAIGATPGRLVEMTFALSVRNNSAVYLRLLACRTVRFRRLWSGNRWIRKSRLIRLRTVAIMRHSSGGLAGHRE